MPSPRTFKVAVRVPADAQKKRYREAPELSFHVDARTIDAARDEARERVKKYLAGYVERSLNVTPDGLLMLLDPKEPEAR